MAIIQENRYDAPAPEVKETDYGAKYVKAATESPVTALAENAEAVEEPEEAPVEKKKGGRPRKSDKKG